MNKLFLILINIIILILTIGIVSACDVLVWQGQYYTGTTFNTGTYEFNFTVYDALTGGDACYSNTTTLTTGSFGEWKTEQNNVSSSCNNASKDYFLNIKINGIDQTPRKRITVWNFLRKDVDEITAGKLEISSQVIAPIIQANSQIVAPTINATNVTTSGITVNNNADILGILKTTSPLKIKQSMEYVDFDDEIIYSSFVQGQNAIVYDIPDIFNNSLVYLKIKSLINDYGYRVVYFDNITKQSLFTLSRNANGRASTIFNLMIVPENKTTDSSFNLCEGNYVDCESNEPDLLVYDDIEAGGSIFSNENVTAAKFIGDGSLLTNLPAGGGLTPVYAESDLNATNTEYASIFTIALTPNKMNIIHAYLAQSSPTTGVAIHNRAIISESGPIGICHFVTQTGPGAEATNNIAVSTDADDTGTAGMTVGTNVPFINTITCTVLADANERNLSIQFESETPAANVTTYAGSYYTHAVN